MARATRVYVVMTPCSYYTEPVASFTVKHEAQTWLQRRREKNPLEKHTMVYSLPDNPRRERPIHTYTEKEFIDA